MSKQSRFQGWRVVGLGVMMAFGIAACGEEQSPQTPEQPPAETPQAPPPVDQTPDAPPPATTPENAPGTQGRSLTPGAPGAPAPDTEPRTPRDGMSPLEEPVDRLEGDADMGEPMPLANQQPGAATQPADGGGAMGQAEPAPAPQSEVSIPGSIEEVEGDLVVSFRTDLLPEDVRQQIVQQSQQQGGAQLQNLQGVVVHAGNNDLSTLRVALTFSDAQSANMVMGQLNMMVGMFRQAAAQGQPQGMAQNPQQQAVQQFVQNLALDSQENVVFISSGKLDEQGRDQLAQVARELDQPLILGLDTQIIPEAIREQFVAGAAGAGGQGMQPQMMQDVQRIFFKVGKEELNSAMAFADEETAQAVQEQMQQQLEQQREQLEQRGDVPEGVMQLVNEMQATREGNVVRVQGQGDVIEMFRILAQIQEEQQREQMDQFDQFDQFDFEDDMEGEEMGQPPVLEEEEPAGAFDGGM